ncbi:GMC family oxidoreductase N-terminal domain-containing protein [Ignatzschineria rhizosphaerae]|uniref:GMC family oxidoreductase N-terminal domain-containing protein n=1 Tax=Ignatzschineria rhizosphaerae TaxID=2923279 RepID=A0ABY3X7E9_9GAMM|nr:GMC family oxidoreductase N-terminal domain-containing protein [Ignatzschineria rhizosphaerae]UNM96661.1 GMC family oxidoreductase N-terminal domain-containing protein [Ignatzschineria rhizosphaerae]
MMMNTYDYIIVGGGSAGCVITHKLIKETDATVLLLEIGPDDKDPFIHMPAGIPFALKKNTFQYETEPEPGLNNRKALVPQGRVIGGGSSVNAMLHVRGNPQDYDDWENLYNCPGWSYKDVLPYFIRAENNESLSSPYHGTHGHIYASEARLRHPISLAYIKAAQEMGFKYVNDFNGPSQEGIGFYQTTTHKGRRASAAYGYLNEVRDNERLSIITGADVRKIIFENTKAVGVEYLHKGKSITCKTNKEIIVTSGSIGSAKLLLLSGVGPQEHLKEMGIDLIANNPQVGKNLHDHLFAPVCAKTPSLTPSLIKYMKGIKMLEVGLEWIENKDGIVASNIVEAGGFLDLDKDGRPETQIHVNPILATSLLNKKAATSDEESHGITLEMANVRPKSRGEVLLRSANPEDQAKITFNYLKEQEDVDGLLAAVKFGLSLLKAPSLKEVVTEVVTPSPELTTDEELIDYIRNTVSTIYHPVGTCRMGDDPNNSAVDMNLKVRGTEGLRVADGSVIPQIPSGNTNIPIIMIAERASDMIIKDYKK